MRWLIVGPYPPELGSGAAAAAAFVAERLTSGDTVHAVSPRPTAAHVHVPLDGPRATWALWRLARAEGADGIWLRVEPGIVLRRPAGRLRPLLERAALALLLRRFRERVLDVGDVGLLPGGRAGRPVLVAATRLVAHIERDAATLEANGAPASRIEHRFVGAGPVPEPAAPPEAPVDFPPPTALEGLAADRIAIEAAVRARAEELEASRVATGTGRDRR